MRLNNGRASGAIEVLFLFFYTMLVFIRLHYNIECTQIVNNNCREHNIIMPVLLNENKKNNNNNTGA